MRIDFLKPNIQEQDIREAVNVLRSGWLTAWNPLVKDFSKKFASYFDAKEAVLVSSGTAALHITLLAAGIKPGDEVITTPLGFVASSNVILYCGAKPVFVDVEPETGLIDVNQVKKAITKKTKAIIPVHLYGQMVDMKKLAAIARRYKLLIIEDACHALESERDGIRPGQLSFAACFSFHVAKNISSGEGGAIITNNPEKAQLMRELADSGIKKEAGQRSMVHFGYKYSYTAFQAALLINQLKRIEKTWRLRKKLFEDYYRALNMVKGVSLPEILKGARHGYHLFVIWVEPEKRDAIRQKLTEGDIVTDVHFNPIHLEPYYRRTFAYKSGSFPTAERIGLGSISLPLYPSLAAKEQKYIIDKLILSRR